MKHNYMHLTCLALHLALNSFLLSFFLFFSPSSHSTSHLCYRSRNHRSFFHWLSLLGSFSIVKTYTRSFVLVQLQLGVAYPSPSSVAVCVTQTLMYIFCFNTEFLHCRRKRSKPQRYSSTWTDAAFASSRGGAPFWGKTGGFLMRNSLQGPFGFHCF